MAYPIWRIQNPKTMQSYENIFLEVLGIAD